ncbi:MAG: hypothetical protein A2Y62_16085 [Candidatus Fischerbacteria bacterium RBG_13_37_8]|uniref:Uncharacterized protein n=1 Tax=Candidatus Fischerbacteria bacterium RBG_13_37_8 TaxID=1817863 RepID=A0A1F5VYV6_9BACT|nr:MAG: hypothetical protein A2Y62_16085 [Candidatus Fischerbacteria bacterium RBG_13_37_8]
MFRYNKYFAVCLICLCMMIILPCVKHVLSEQVRTNLSSIETIEFAADELYISQTQIPLEQLKDQLPNKSAWDTFTQESMSGHVYIDPRSGRPVS